eukprot:6185696-Pleurochrysis_carterae.AAC.6
MGYSRCFESSMYILISIGLPTSYDCGKRVPSLSHGEAAQQPRHTNATRMAALARVLPCRLAVRPLGA